MESGFTMHRITISWGMPCEKQGIETRRRYAASAVWRRLKLSARHVWSVFLINLTSASLFKLEVGTRGQKSENSTSLFEVCVLENSLPACCPRLRSPTMVDPKICCTGQSQDHLANVHPFSSTWLLARLVRKPKVTWLLAVLLSVTSCSLAAPPPDARKIIDARS